MEQILIIGIGNVDYTNKEGRHISGKNIYYTYTDKNTEGFRADRFYLTLDKFTEFGIQLNSSYKLFYDKFGHVSFVEKVK